MNSSEQTFRWQTHELIAHEKRQRKSKAEIVKEIRNIWVHETKEKKRRKISKSEVSAWKREKKSIEEKKVKIENKFVTCRIKQIKELASVGDAVGEPPGQQQQGAARASPPQAQPAQQQPDVVVAQEWNEECDRFTFDDSDRFEEDSLCSWSSEPESLCNNWRGWKRPLTNSNFGNGAFKKQNDGKLSRPKTQPNESH